MLSRIRAALKSWIVIGLMVLLAVSFAVFGVGDVFTARFSTAVIQAGSREISPQQFTTIFNNYKRQLEQQAQRPITVDEMARYGVPEQIVRALSGEEAFAELLIRAGIAPADGLVGRQLREQRAFFDSVTGQFSQAQYLRLLSENDIVPADFEASIRDEVRQAHFEAALLSGARVPRLYTASAVAFQQQTRNVSWFNIAPLPADQPPAPTDAQLTQFMQENADRLRRPELRALTVVRFSAADAAVTATVDPAEVARQFAFRRDSLSTPERRSFVQIAVPDAAAGARVVAALRAGGDPAAVARSVSADPVVYTDQPRTAVVDPAVATVAFALPAGQVSDVIRGDLGSSVVRVTSVTPGTVATLESVRPQIEQELRTRAAAERLNDLVERYEASHGGGATLVEAARAAGVPALTLQPVRQNGQAQNGQPSSLPPQLLQLAFELPQGGESDVTPAGEGEYFAVRVDRVIAPSLPPLAEVRAPLVQVWTVQQLARRVEARANALAGRVRAGEAIQAVAASVGATVTTNPALSREQAAQALGEQVGARAFGARRNEVLTGANTQVFVVARVAAASAPAAAIAAQTVEQARPIVTRSVLEEAGALSRSWAAETIRPRTDLARARQAIGLDAPSGAADTAPAR